MTTVNATPVYPTVNSTLSALSANGTQNSQNIIFSVVAGFAAFFSIFGLIGNAIVIWVLTFKMKRNKYTVYILNLAIADFIYLFFDAVVMLLLVDKMLNARNPSSKTLQALEIIYDFGYTAGMLFLTAISIERCLSVLFPIWHKCYRPKHLSTWACGFLWLFGALLSLLDNFVCPANDFNKNTYQCTAMQIFASVLTFAIIVPLMVMSSFTLIHVVRTTSKKCRPPKIYVAIIITVLVFLISVIPIKVLWILLYFKLFPNNFHSVALFFASTYCTMFNSSANPFIYFFVGRQKMKRFSSSVNEALSRVFKEDETDQSTEYYTESNSTISTLN
ncbi:hypothetical protein XENTR_v10009088 [Xenopus tropicalis]|uniref:MAS1 proto-oncogene like, G protein-coupled receptor n=1 Tax=Xenopus tropicalis TaxID=8364 RepID=A0A803KCX8_XENTR|nr:proto-oncogene Mas [Xenopus tropicalis]KAE8617479.1 hypothetical protein XENTR_v10009088 [Xenopus tropicalis]|eukprot:XP_002938917.1 PREDICTED: proto-oncogene Mas [Xenopus tropicalis]